MTCLTSHHTSYCRRASSSLLLHLYHSTPSTSSVVDCWKTLRVTYTLSTSPYTHYSICTNHVQVLYTRTPAALHKSCTKGTNHHHKIHTNFTWFVHDHLQDVQGYLLCCTWFVHDFYIVCLQMLVILLWLSPVVVCVHVILCRLQSRPQPVGCGQTMATSKPWQQVFREIPGHSLSSLPSDSTTSKITTINSSITWGLLAQTPKARRHLCTV